MKKKSPETSLARYREAVEEIRGFIANVTAQNISGDGAAHWYDHAVISAYREFEKFILDISIARINRDPKAFYSAIGVEFGQHIGADQCAFLLVGDGYFDFKGHSGLVDVLSKAAGKPSPMVDAAKVPESRKAFEILTGLRNFVAHGSDQSVDKALAAMRNWEPARKNLGRAGVWLRTVVGGQTRFERLLNQIDTLCASLANASKS